MGLGDRIRAWFDAPRAPSIDEWVVATVVPFHEGPMVHSAIEAAGIVAVLQWVRPLPAHGMDQYRIVVRQGDLAEAEAILADLRAPGPPPDPFDLLE